MFESVQTKHYKLEKWIKEKDDYHIYFKRKKRLWKHSILVKITENKEGHRVFVLTKHKGKIAVKETYEILQQLEEFFTKKHITRMHYLSGAKWNVTGVLFKPKLIFGKRNLMN